MVVMLIHSAQKFLDTYKSSIFTKKCFILGKLKAYYLKQVNVLFILIPNLKESVDKLQSSNPLNGDRYVFKSCKWSHLSHWTIDWADLCWWMVTFATFQNVPVSIQMVRTLYLSTKSYKFGIKVKKTSTCFLWYAYNLPNMKHFWKKIGTFRCPGTFFAECTSSYNFTFVMKHFFRHQSSSDLTDLLCIINCMYCLTNMQMLWLLLAVTITHFKFIIFTIIVIMQFHSKQKVIKITHKIIETS